MAEALFDVQGRFTGSGPEDGHHPIGHHPTGTPSAPRPPGPARPVQPEPLINAKGPVPQSGGRGPQRCRGDAGGAGGAAQPSGPPGGVIGGDPGVLGGGDVGGFCATKMVTVSPGATVASGVGCWS